MMIMPVSVLDKLHLHYAIIKVKYTSHRITIWMKAGSMKSISIFSWKLWIYILGNWSLDPNISYSYPAPGSDSCYEKWSLLEVHVDSFTAVKCTKPIRICFCHRHITIIRKAIVQAFHSLHTSLLFTFPHSSFPRLLERHDKI